MGLYPNPVSTQQLQLYIFSKNTQDVVVNLRNLLGQSMHQQELQLEEGKTLIQLKTHAIPNGFYLLEIESKTNKTTRLIEKIEFLN
jgi:hypothetical protein